MIDTENKTCGECKWLITLDSEPWTHYECRRMPPQMVDGGMMYTYPSINEDCPACGEFAIKNHRYE